MFNKVDKIDEQVKPAGIPYALADGTIVNLTLSYGMLARLRSLDRAAYDAYNKAQTLLEKEPDLQGAILLHTAYLCGRIAEHGTTEGALGQEAFLSRMLGNRNLDGEAFKMLFSPNPTTASAKRS